jgi:hypothetical protein
MPRAHGRNHAACIWKKSDGHALTGNTRTFFAQCLSGPLNRIYRKRRSFFRGNRHEQSSLPFELHGERCWSNGNGAFFPTNLERHSRLYPRFSANVFRNHQSARLINGCFHAIEITIYKAGCQAGEEPRFSFTSTLLHTVDLTQTSTPRLSTADQIRSRVFGWTNVRSYNRSRAVFFHCRSIGEARSGL